VLSPVVGPLDDVPHDLGLSAGVGPAIVRVARSEAPFDCLVSGGSFAVDAQEVAEQQRELLREAASFADVDVGPRLSWWFPEVALRPLGVVGTVGEAGLLERVAERNDRFQRSADT
jgi:hypothetical protein